MIASLIIVLHLLGIITIESATTSLYVAGALLIIAELGVVSFGLLFMNGALAIYAGYALHLGRDLIFGIAVGWSVLFGIAFLEISVIAIVIFVHLKLRNMKQVTGTQSMIGEEATVLEWNGKNGSVRYEGEIWNAQSKTEYDLNPKDTVKVSEVTKLNLTITA
ncbi:MAG: NfeD family protein [Alphaproteobacteria bacterium]